MGASDPDFCVLLNVCLYLESIFPTEINDEGLVNCFAFAGNALNTKKRVSRILKDLFRSEEFKNRFCDGTDLGSLLEEWLGSHSFQKCAAMHARHNSSSRDEIDLRGRWKDQKRQVDTYVDTSVPYLDAKVCASLCVCVAIRYNLVVGSGLDDCWVYSRMY